MKQTSSPFVLALALCAAFAAAAPAAQSAQSGDRAAVQQAALDYVTAVYESKPELIAKSVSPDLAKHGFMRQADGSYRRGRMTYDQLLEVARTWNAAKNRDLSIKEVIVGEVYDQTATAIVKAQWGLDHMQLAKLDGQWKIINIVWQTHPPKK
ncbi:MAG: nuclear transport factor 2 family protein [Acidobacteriota bacterium]|nr:nuclear transport factor 2 family protein [Acidobacteriota bacterium]